MNYINQKLEYATYLKLFTLIETLSMKLNSMEEFLEEINFVRKEFIRMYNENELYSKLEVAETTFEFIIEAERFIVKKEGETDFFDYTETMKDSIGRYIKFFKPEEGTKEIIALPDLTGVTGDLIEKFKVMVNEQNNKNKNKENEDIKHVIYTKFFKLAKKENIEDVEDLTIISYYNLSNFTRRVIVDFNAVINKELVNKKIELEVKIKNN